MDKYLLTVNLSQFDEGEEDFSQFISGDGDLDVDGLVEHYRNAEPEETQEDEDTEPETEETSDESEEPETKTEGEETETETEEQPEGDYEEPPTDKRSADQAFAEMRRRAEQNEPLAKWVQDLATQQGFENPQELIDAFEQQKLEREAKEQGVPVDVYQRLHKLEEENKEKEDSLRSERFNTEVESVKTKYNLGEEDLQTVFQYMGKNGYDAGDIPFEDAYVLANRETLIKDAEERGRQTYLEEKKKQQQSATPDVGTNKNDKPSDNDLDYSKEGIFSTLKEMGIDID